MKKFIVYLLLFVMVISFAACSSQTNNDVSVSTQSANNNPPDLEQGTPDTKPDATTPPVDSSSSIIINFNNLEAINSEGVVVNDNAVTITAAGTYEVSGKLNNGQLIVDADDCIVYLILNNADIYCQNSAPLFVKKADHVYLSLANGSVNKLSDGSSYSYEPGITEPDAALFSKADMTISGTGTLEVKSNYNDGIANRDTLVIESGIINVDAVTHGIKGKDFLSILGGTINVRAGVDAIKSTNDVDSTLGYIVISGGTLSLDAQDEAISAVTSVTVSGGNIDIDTANNGIKANTKIEISKGEVKILTDDKGLVCDNEKISSAANVTVNGAKLKSNY